MAIPPGFFQATTEIVLTGDPDPYNIVTMHAYSLAEYNEAEHCNSVMSGWTRQFNGLLSSSARITRTLGRFGQDGGEPTIHESTIGAINGASAAAKLPQNCALLLKKRTNLGGRRGRGRNYVPLVLSEANVDNGGNIDSSTLSDAQSRANALLTEWASEYLGVNAPVPLYLEHFASPSGSAVPAPSLVTKLLVDPIIATQRRRLRR